MTSEMEKAFEQKNKLNQNRVRCKDLASTINGFEKIFCRENDLVTYCSAINGKEICLKATKSSPENLWKIDGFIISERGGREPVSTVTDIGLGKIGELRFDDEDVENVIRKMVNILGKDGLGEQLVEETSEDTQRGIPV